MTSGLSDRGVFEHKAGTKWRYNTPDGGKIPPDAVLVFDIELIEVK